MTYYSNLIQHLGHMFEKSELTHFKILSSQAEEKLRQIEDQKEIERAFSECKKYLQDNRPDIWASTRGSSERILSDLETVKTGLNDRGLSSL